MTDTINGWRRRIRLELLAQHRDRHVDGARLQITALTEDVLEQFGARHDPILVTIEPAHDADLARRKRDALAAADDGHTCQVDHGAIDLDRVERFARRRTTAERATRASNSRAENGLVT